MISKAKQKLIRSLEQKRGRQAAGLYVAEGPKVVADLMALAAPRYVAATADWLAQAPLPAACETAEVSADELRRTSFLQHPQQVMALFALPEGLHDEPLALAQRLRGVAQTSLILALDGVQDPGNLGTIIRIADWFGVRHIVCSADTADAFAPKVVQATMGSIARVAMHYTRLPEFIAALGADTPVYGTLLSGTDIYRSPLTPTGVVVMGNEGKGISPEVERLVSRALLIPAYHQMATRADSLNVAIATAVTMAEFRRREESAS